jgi:endogenous inhibitor of DNA gyrase (YacG/DUF329 family)
MKNILQVKCSKKDCKVEATEKAILYGKTTPVCQEHKRTTDLGNWQHIQFDNLETV